MSIATIVLASFSIDNGIRVDFCCFRGVILSPYNCSWTSMEVFNINFCSFTFSEGLAIVDRLAKFKECRFIRSRNIFKKLRDPDHMPFKVKFLLMVWQVIKTGQENSSKATLVEYNIFHNNRRISKLLCWTWISSHTGQQSKSFSSLTLTCS